MTVEVLWDFMQQGISCMDTPPDYHRPVATLEFYEPAREFRMTICPLVGQMLHVNSADVDTLEQVVRSKMLRLGHMLGQQKAAPCLLKKQSSILSRPSWRQMDVSNVTM